jgi:hypothetical protein
MKWQKHVVHRLAVIAKNAHPVKVVTVAVVVARRMKKGKNAIAVHQIPVKHRQKNRLKGRRQ